MPKPLLLTVIAALAPFGAVHQRDVTATHVAAGDIRAAADRAPKDAVSDQQIRMVDAGGTNVGVGVVSRPAVANGGGIVHDQLIEVYYVLEGTGMLVTGGTVVGGTRLPATSSVVRDLAGPSTTFQRTQGGERRRVAPGDVVIIPAGVPHWFENVEGTIKYLVVRVDPDQVIALK
jgi:mannose-6-phosphate isomerase-like protein (cupin superfamily)